MNSLEFSLLLIGTAVTKTGWCEAHAPLRAVYDNKMSVQQEQQQKYMEYTSLIAHVLQSKFLQAISP